MKKILLIMLFILMLCGCENREEMNKDTVENPTVSTSTHETSEVKEETEKQTDFINAPTKSYG
ncbi:MAG: hypothetical protein IKV64_03500, partial [Clostridia bacterium]|nr:hypothetical protein [Clostridia bacterium]